MLTEIVRRQGKGLLIGLFLVSMAAYDVWQHFATPPTTGNLSQATWFEDRGEIFVNHGNGKVNCFDLSSRQQHVCPEDILLELKLR
jgi:hypothetical protein